MGEMLPDTREMRALEVAAADAVERMKELFGNGAVAGEEAHDYRMQLDDMKARLHRLADVFARADAVYGEAHPVYTVDVRLSDNGIRGRRQPPAKVFRSQEDAVAFVADIEFFDTVTIQFGMRRGDDPAAGTLLAPVPTRSDGESGRAGDGTPPPAARYWPDAFLNAFVTLFAFSSTLLPSACPSCSHEPTDHIYVGEFTSFALPGGAIGVLPARGEVVCRLDTCTGTWNLSVLSRENTILLPPEMPPGNDST